MEVALRAEQGWTGRYVLNFDRVLAEYRERERTTQTCHVALLIPPQRITSNMAKTLTSLCFR